MQIVTRADESCFPTTIMSSDTPLIVGNEVTSSLPPRRKPLPPGLRFKSTYTPSEDGTDENLLILLHGLGQSC